MVDFLLREECLHIFILQLQIASVFPVSVMVSIGVERLEDIICDAADDRVDLEPVVQSLVLVFVKMPDFLIFDGLELFVRLAEFLELVALDRVYELVFELVPPLILQCVVRPILETEDGWFWLIRIPTVSKGAGVGFGAGPRARAGLATCEGIQTMSPDHLGLDLSLGLAGQDEADRVRRMIRLGRRCKPSLWSK